MLSELGITGTFMRYEQKRKKLKRLRRMFMKNKENSYVAEAIPPFFPATNYDEPYRGQFHFSSQCWWMNDVNGLWFWDGIYYMTYQATPNALEPVHDECSVGMAVSPDMVRWEQRPIPFRPNSLGSVYSGSSIIDLHNVSGFKTGENPVFIGFYSYTATGVGIVYSNDLGLTWQLYDGNPVIAGLAHEFRDPHVFWHDPSEKWCLAIHGFGDGVTSFYSSKNLKDWKKESEITFGFECPDIFEFPVDGDKSNKKWLLLKGDGQYLTGQFDGSVFTPDSLEPIDLVWGGDFYASQTFFRDTFPDSRLVQLAWMGNPPDSCVKKKCATSPWNQCATLPVELKLETRPEGLRLTRTPIKELNNIHGKVVKWKTKVLIPGENPLSGLFSKSCEIAAEFDLTDIDASEIVFHLADYPVRYDIKERTLLGKPCPARNDRLKLRIFLDWSQLEVFSDDYAFSWSERYFFSPERSDLRLEVDGRVKLKSMTVTEMGKAFGKIEGQV
jgi:sucrose-6-phosphate hydrolase SacC (GH32 family)